MSTGKRLRSTPVVADPRPTTMIHQTPKLDTTSESESKPFTLELLPESELPHRQELTRLNGLIHGDMKRTVANRSLQVHDVYPTLFTVGKHYKSLDVDQITGWPSLRENEQAVGQILQMAQDAYRVGNYSCLMRIKSLQRSPQALSRSSSGTSISSEAPDPVAEGWNTPFIGDAHVALARNVQEMFETAVTDSHQRKYMTHATIIQSSGSGKSRLVDKVAETIFTIPFNVREARDAASGAWPPADGEIRDVLVLWARQGGEMRMQARYFCFFTAVFEEVRKEVERCLPQPASAHTPFDWRAHLGRNESERRDALYARVVNSAAVRGADAMRSDVESATVRRFRKTARSALKRLLAAICPRTTCHMSHTDDARSSTIKDIHVLIYFDEAHVLANQLGRSGTSSHCEPGTTALDVLFPLLDDFRDHGLFAIFMSTQSHLEHLDFVDSPAPARGVHRAPYVHAPITETPFDCFGDRPINPSRLRVEDVCNIAFMACFGRPMWRSLLLPFCDNVLANACGTPRDPSFDAYECNRRCEDLLSLAQAKLVFHLDLHRAQMEFCQAAQTAVLDVRIMLPFDPRCSDAYRLQMELVASHMRTVYSVPQHREYVRSGYPSEPILAEAAARQLYLWRTIRDGPWRLPGEPAMLVLRDNVHNGLLDRGEIGGAVGRLLLTLARDRAAVATSHPSSCRFSRAVPVAEFVKALFPPAIAQQVLESKPDNLPSDHDRDHDHDRADADPGRGPAATVTFEEAFKDAVLNFTHFASWDEGAVPDEHAAAGCLVRSMAAVCHKTASGVDVFIPVLLDKSAPLRPEGVTALLVHINRKQGRGKPMAAHAIDEKVAELFHPTTPADGPGQTEAAPLRPYITLTMELGHPDPRPSPHGDASAAPVDDVNSRSREAPRVPVVVGRQPVQASYCYSGGAEVEHPRYSITACGCSRLVYRVVGEEESRIYGHILAEGDPLREHPRQDARSLDLVRRLKPEFSDASWDWIANDDGLSTEVQPEPLSEDSDED